jgi:heptosyltransferase-2
MKIVVIRFSSLGDCTLLCPFLDHLKSHGATEIAVVTKRAYIELFAAVRAVDRIVAIDDKAGWRGLAQVVRSLRNRGYRVIDAHNNWRSRVVARGLGGSAARIRKYYRERVGLILFKRRSEIPTVSARYSALGERLGFPRMATAAGGIQVPKKTIDAVGARLPRTGSKIVAMAPGSRWPMKQWGVEKFAAVARRITDEYNCHIVLLGDREDEEVAERVSSGLGSNVTNLAGRTGILEAAAAIQHAIAFIGNDSGLMHVAEAVGVPVVAVFGPTVEAFGYYPSLAASKVIERDIGCRPCSRNGSRPCPKGTQECMTGIPVEPVVEAFTDLVEERGPAHRVVS